MQLILTHNSDPTKPLPAMPQQLLNSVSVVLAGVRVGMVSSRIEGGRQGVKGKLNPPRLCGPSSLPPSLLIASGYTIA